MLRALIWHGEARTTLSPMTIMRQPAGWSPPTVRRRTHDSWRTYERQHYDTRRLCVQDTLSLSARLVLYTRYPIVARAIGLAAAEFVYKIPYRRARAWPSGCSAFRPSASREQRYLAYNCRVRARAKVSCIQRLAWRLHRP